MASRNPFALLAGEGGDDSDHEQQSLSKQSKPASSAAPAAAAAAGRSANSAPARRTVPGQTVTRPQKETKELPAATDAPGFEGERGRDDRGTGFQRGSRGGRGRGERGSGRGRGAGGARNARPDRRSATGITDSDKKEHQGWGGDDGKRELEAETAAATDAAAEKAAAVVDGEATPAAAEGDAAAAPAAEKQAEVPAAAAAAPAEEEDNSKSYEEYLAERKAAGRGILESLTGASGRKANEGSDDSQWKDGVLLEKSEGDAYFVGQQKEKTVKQKQRKEKNLLEVEFAAPPRTDAGRGEGGRGRGRGERGTGRGGRGGDRGSGRGRGAAGGAPRGSANGPRGGRGGANGANAVNVDDSAAFPSLS